MNIREKLEALDHLDRSPDRHVESVRQMLLDRSRVGLAKYGVSTERTDLNRAQWLRHLQEELLDASVYIQTLIAAEQTEERPAATTPVCRRTCSCSSSASIATRSASTRSRPRAAQT